MKVAWLCLLLFATCCVGKELSVLAITYPPYTAPSIKNNGFAFEKLIYRAELKDYQISAQFVPPSRAGKILKSGNWCLSFYPPLEKEKSAYRWVLSPEPIKLGFFRLTQPEPFEWHVLSNLKGKRVAMLRSYSKQGLTALMKTNGMDVLEVEDLNQGFRLLLKNRVDMVFADEVSGEYIANMQDIEMERLQFSRNALQETPWHVWVNKSCTEIYQLAKSNAAASQ